MLRKDLALTDCEIKFSGDKPRQFAGYASVFGGVDSYGDTIVRGAYAETLAGRKRPVKMFYSHNPTRVIGKWLDLREDDKGLLVTGELTPGHTDAENTWASLKHGTLDGLSIGYNVPDGGEKQSSDDHIRVLSRIDLVEISPVSLPADDDARIDLASVKSMLEECKSISELEDILRDAGGFSRSSAKAFLARMKAVLREADPAEDKEPVHQLVLKAIPKSLIQR